jgi:tripartite-type tricarboxylate transporter receptor subunit TctC
LPRLRRRAREYDLRASYACLRIIPVKLARLLIAGALAIVPVISAAQSYPSKPIRLVVPFPPAGATDILSRELARLLSERLKQQVIVDNKPGAGGTLGTDLVAKAPADGYTIQMATSSTHSIGPSLNPKIPYNAQTDFTPVAHVANATNVLVVAPSVKANTVAELIAEIKAKPGQYNFGSSGSGTIVHLTAELFKAMTGTYIVHIPYRGTALVIPDMVGGQIQLLFDNVASALPHIKDGRVKALAVTSLKRSPLLPQLPTVADTVPGFESNTWFGVFGPKNLPPEVTQRLNAEINAVLKTPEFQDRLRALGYDAAGGSPADFSKVVAGDTAKWARLIKERTITGE